MASNKPRAKSQRLTPSGRAQRVAEQQKAQRQRRFLEIVGGIVVIVIIAVGVLIAVNHGNGSGDLKDIVPGVAVPDGVATDGLTIGSADAPLKITEYGDYQCPYCFEVDQEAYPTLMTKYIETGDVSITFSPMAFLGDGHDPDESALALQAALCANDQGKFWEMHSVIYTNHNGENIGNLSSSRLKQMAAQVPGLDTSAFNSCLDNGTHEADVDKYNQAAAAANVNSTPTFITNTGDTFGWSNLPALEKDIDSALAKAKAQK